MSVGITNVLGSSGAVQSTNSDPWVGLPRLRSLFALSSQTQAPITFDMIVGALLGDIVHGGSLTPADQVYSGRYTRPGASQPAVMPDNEPDRDNKIINQGAAPYRGQQLGNGSSTISGSGCTIASITMAANDLTGSNHGLLTANAEMVKAGAFEAGTSDVSLAKGGAALGLVAVGGRASGTDRNITAAAGLMDRGNPPMRMVAGVDYKGDSKTDHFVTIRRMNEDGRLDAVDPAGGRRIQFERQGDRWVEVRQPGQEPYKGYVINDFQLFAAKESVPNRVQPLMKA